LEQHKFAPAIELDFQKRADLAATAATPGFKVIHEIMRAEVDSFLLAHINTKADNKEAIYASFVLAKTAAQFYEGVSKRINEEVLQYTAGLGNQAPQDATEGVLDIGEVASTIADLPNFFGEGDAVIDE
jgi:hypothetical protein